MLLTKQSSLNKLMIRLQEKISFGEGIRYSIPDLWNCFDYKGQEKFVDEKGIMLVNPYKFYFSCINDFIMPKKDLTKDYNLSGSQILGKLNEKKEYSGGDWIIQSSVYVIDIRISTSWDHNGNGFLEDCNENGFKETGTFLKTIGLLPFLKKMGINTLNILCILDEFFCIDSRLKDTMTGYDFTVEEEFRALVEACHILDIRIIVDITSESIQRDNELISYYQNNLGIDGARLNMETELPAELVSRIIESARRLDNDFCFIAEGLSEEETKFNIINNYNWSVEAKTSINNIYKFICELVKLKSPIFVCAETSDSLRIAAGEDGKVLSKFLIILNEFLPNSVPVMTSGVEIYETKPLNGSIELSWINDNRWDIPDTLGAIAKIKNQFLDTFTNPNNFFSINFESPYTTAIGFAYIVEGKKWRPNENLIIIVGNSDLNNAREYTLFLENIRNESGNCSKKAWLMYSPNEWSHDIYDFDHSSDLQLRFQPGEVKVLIM